MRIELEIVGRTEAVPVVSEVDSHADFVDNMSAAGNTAVVELGVAVVADTSGSDTAVPSESSAATDTALAVAGRDKNSESVAAELALSTDFVVVGVVRIAQVGVSSLASPRLSDWTTSRN